MLKGNKLKLPIPIQSSYQAHSTSQSVLGEKREGENQRCNHCCQFGLSAHNFLIFSIICIVHTGLKRLRWLISFVVTQCGVHTGVEI